LNEVIKKNIVIIFGQLL